VARVAAEQANPDIDPRFLFTEVGYNVRGTELAAAIGLVQFPKRIAWAERRRAIAKEWTVRLDADLFQPIQWAPGAVPFAFPLVLRGDGRDRLMAHLEAAGIETRPLVAGNLARQPAMKKVKHRVAGPLTGADFLHTNALYVGLHPGLTDDQVGYLPQVLAGFRP
jgi:CDP-6-deoxy-D-xylo-4-hexulose-3-dehydrase